MLTTSAIKAKYGVPNEQGTYLVTIKLPYPMFLAWDRSVRITKMRCHKLVADKFIAVFNDLLASYGNEEIHLLGIDLYGGCFNFRKMRGGTDWSRHSWGIAIDLDPERNGLKTPYSKSNFAKPEYAPLHAIFETHGFENLGKVAGYDAMHWQVVS